MPKKIKFGFVNDQTASVYKRISEFKRLLFINIHKKFPKLNPQIYQIKQAITERACHHQTIFKVNCKVTSHKVYSILSKFEVRFDFVHLILQKSSKHIKVKQF